MIVHVQTAITTVFGELDAEGNVVNKRTVSLEVPTLKADLFAAACEQLVRAKADGEAKSSVNP